ARAIIAQDVAMARRWAARLPRWLLVGEEHSLRPDGFAFGNSPVDVADARTRGASVIMATTNGTRAIRACHAARAILIGALVNRTAVMREALAAGADVIVVCAGTDYGTRITLEDVYAAGRLAAVAAAAGATLTDAATIALRLAASFPDAAAAFAASGHGQRLAAIGFERDLIACAAEDTSGIVPRVTRRGRRPAVSLG
ncbi:MAG: 2-phosphosulfolactate phosphatase, partial [Dehalococcoidia bacterium]|nr:2-phosphosulfolactate phosphatase [Dehalococcoidia bacterium]